MLSLRRRGGITANGCVVWAQMQAQAEALEAKQEAAKALHAAADAEAPAGAHPDTDAPSDAAGAETRAAEAAGGTVEPVPAGKSGFRMSAEQLKRLNHLLGKYIGTHNFHNYTVQVCRPRAAQLDADTPAADSPSQNGIGHHSIFDVFLSGRARNCARAPVLRQIDVAGVPFDVSLGSPGISSPRCIRGEVSAALLSK